MLIEEFNILPVPCLHISETVCYIKSSTERMKCNEEVHHQCICQKADLHVQFCRTTLFKNTSANVGIKLYNKLPNTVKKLENIWEFKKRIIFYCNTLFIQWMNIRPTRFYCQSFVIMHNFIIFMY
jgi:hypothetical protein